MTSSDWVLSALTAALVLVTSYYAWQNHRMVQEMRHTREATHRPGMVLDLALGFAVIDVRVVNAGPGPAIDVDVQIIYEPADGASMATATVQWRTPALLAGQSHDFALPHDEGRTYEEFGQTYRRIRMVGSVRDALGARHAVDESIEDLAAWAERLIAARQILPDDPMGKIAEALDKFVRFTERWGAFGARGLHVRTDADLRRADRRALRRNFPTRADIWLASWRRRRYSRTRARRQVR